MSIGKVDDFVLNSQGDVEYLIVDNGGKLMTVPWDAAKFDFAKRTAVINITQDVYKTIPTYTVEKYPAYFTPAYRTEIYKFYNLTPRQERKVDRIENRRP